jgi:hypothetical protein
MGLELVTGRLAASRVPSDLLPKSLWAYVGYAWDAITDVTAIPARVAGLDERREGWERALPYFLFAVLLAPLLLNVEWPRPVESFRLTAFGDGGVLHGVLLPIVQLVFASSLFILILSLNRLWSINEQARELFAARLQIGEADKLPDLQRLGVATGFLLILVLPLSLRALNATACTYDTCLFSGPTTLGAWLWYCLVAILPTSYYTPNLTSPIAEIGFWASLPKYIIWPVLNAVLVFGVFEVVRISKVKELAVDSLENSPTRAVAVGTRILNTLLRIVAHDDDEDLAFNFYKHAIEAMAAIGSPQVIPTLKNLAEAHRNAFVRNRAVKALAALRDQLKESPGLVEEINEFLHARLAMEQKQLVLTSIKVALGISEKQHAVAADDPDPTPSAANEGLGAM